MPFLLCIEQEASNGKLEESREEANIANRKTVTSQTFCRLLCASFWQCSFAFALKYVFAFLRLQAFAASLACLLASGEFCKVHLPAGQSSPALRRQSGFVCIRGRLILAQTALHCTGRNLLELCKGRTARCGNLPRGARAWDRLTCGVRRNSGEFAGGAKQARRATQAVAMRSFALGSAFEQSCKAKLELETALANLGAQSEKRAKECAMNTFLLRCVAGNGSANWKAAAELQTQANGNLYQVQSNDFMRRFAGCLERRQGETLRRSQPPLLQSPSRDWACKDRNAGKVCENKQEQLDANQSRNTQDKRARRVRKAS